MKWSPIDTLAIGILILIAVVLFGVGYGVYMSQIYITPVK